MKFNSKSICLIFATIFISTISLAQVGIGTTSPNASAKLDITSTTQGLLPPRMTIAQRDAIVSPIAGLMIFCTDNFGGEVEVFNGIMWVNMNGRISNSTLSIGDYYQGGKVAYILVSGDPGYDANVKHGLIAATSDQSTGIQWYNGSFSNTYARGTAIGTGLANTNTIITSQGATATSYAAGLARAYTGGGYTDWYLPSIGELYEIYLNKTAIGGFEYGSRYWSSSEVASGSGLFAWYTDCSDQTNSIYEKNFAFYVRAVRSF